MAVKKIFVAAGISLWILGMWISTADAGRSWKDHKPPYDFLFGNHIDTHQETRLEKDGRPLRIFLHYLYRRIYSGRVADRQAL